MEFGVETWKKGKLVKVASGAHHSLAMTADGKVYGWGDAESGKIGRMSSTRHRIEQAMKIESVGARDAVDIFCGNHTSFYKSRKDTVFAWGLNNHGQLGIGNRMNTCVPTKIKELDNLKVNVIAGGEHHTVACTSDGKVFCWGRNDEG